MSPRGQTAGTPGLGRKASHTGLPGGPLEDPRDAVLSSASSRILRFQVVSGFPCITWVYDTGTLRTPLPLGALRELCPVPGRWEDRGAPGLPEPISETKPHNPGRDGDLSPSVLACRPDLSRGQGAGLPGDPMLHPLHLAPRSLFSCCVASRPGRDCLTAPLFCAQIRDLGRFPWGSCLCSPQHPLAVATQRLGVGIPRRLLGWRV